MSLLFKTGTFTKPQTPTDTIAVTGVGFEPKVVILWTVNVNSNGFFSQHLHSMGASDETRDRSIVTASEDNVAISDTARRQANKVIQMTDFDALIWEADITSFDSDGFSLDFTTNNGDAVTINYLCLGGDDLTDVRVDDFNAATSTGEQPITGVGFEPDCILLFGIQNQTAPPSLFQGSALAFLGTATGTGAESGATVYLHRGDKADAAGGAASVQRDEIVLGLATVTDKDPTITAVAAFTSFDSDGFTINWSDAFTAAMHIFYVALKGGSYKVGKETSPTSTGTKATTGVGFEPKGLLFFSHSDPDDDTVQEGAHFSLTASDDTDAGGSLINSKDEANPTETDRSQQATKAVQLSNTDSPSSADAEADMDSLDSDGYTLDWTTVDAAALEFHYIAFGDAAGQPIQHRTQGIPTGSGSRDRPVRWN